MTKNITIITILLIIVAVGIVYLTPKKEVLAPTVEGPKPIELCFAKIGTPNERGFYDKYTLRMLLSGEGGVNATGELKFLPAEKDSKVGKFEGTVSAVDKKMMARTADLWWNSLAEGMREKEELKIIFGEGVANIGLGLMDYRKEDNTVVYKNPNEINYSLALNDVACSDITERENVESYLRANIGTLSPVKAVLGGNWNVLTYTVDLGKNTGTVTYEDGHIQEKKNFSYTINEKSEVQSMTLI